MLPSVTDLESQALQLAPQERAHLADRLLASLSPDNDVEDAWAEEVERRLAEIEGGSAALVPVEAAIARARSAIR